MQNGRLSSAGHFLFPQQLLSSGVGTPLPQLLFFFSLDSMFAVAWSNQVLNLHHPMPSEGTPQR